MGDNLSWWSEMFNQDLTSALCYRGFYLRVMYEPLHMYYMCEAHNKEMGKVLSFRYNSLGQDIRQVERGILEMFRYEVDKYFANSITEDDFIKRRTDDDT